MKEELEQLAAAHPNVHLHVTFTQPGEGDVAGRDFNRAGRLDTKAMLQALPKDRYEFFMCGPDQMMEDMVGGLQGLGVPRADIHQESFASLGGAAPKAVESDIEGIATDTVKVQFARSGVTCEWNPGDGTLLEVGQDAGLNMACGCKVGICGACKVKVEGGQVVYSDEVRLNKPDECLPCVGFPAAGTETLVIDS
jgi:Na+-transporting NADH:ubiquinone oxidoreductase subunit NqrF